ncbi:MAG: hypothetical protein J5992_06785 [Oscillospiraceae bacterium]|nr:hypothetical protein [Oscillospiraceae bacterium]
MYRFEIFKNNEENSSVTLVVRNRRDINPIVYKHLTNSNYDNHVSEETAIDIACWCELASVGETYETDELTVIVKE